MRYSCGIVRPRRVDRSIYYFWEVGSPKSTRILTNVSGWEPRKCPDLANHDAHTAVISGPNSEERPSFFGIPEGTCVFMTPEELHLDIAAAAIQK